MRKIKLLLFISFVFASCQNERISQLNKQVSELKNLNIELKDSLNQMDYYKIISSELIGIPHNMEITPDQSNKFSFFLITRQEFPSYNVYRITKDGTEEKRELLIKNHKHSNFQFDFIPKSNKDLSFDLVAEFDLDSITVSLLSRINTPIK